MRAGNKLAVIMIITLVLLFTGNGNSVAVKAALQNKSGDNLSETNISKKMEDLSGSVDSFVYEVIMNSYTDYMRQQSVKPSYSKLKAEISKNYNGKLTNKVKSVISAENANGYKLYHTISNSPAQIWKTSSKAVQNKAKNIFGSSLTSIELPVWKSKNKNNIDDFEMQLAKNKKGEIFTVYCDAENNIKSEIVRGVKGKKGVFTITKEYQYYIHWSNKKPDYTITAIIKLKLNSKSSYGYNIIALSIK